MDYGKVRIFDSSEENNLTRGIRIRFFFNYMRFKRSTPISL